MWREAVLTQVLVIGILDTCAVAQTPTLLRFEDKQSRFAISQAIKGAAIRLERRACQEVLSDFTDETGQSLSATLAASGRTPVEAFGLLWFVDDPRAPQCESGARLAFTQTGSHLIHVCGQHFTSWFTRHRATTEIIVIHEFLHTLGLAENPPTSEAITQRVTVRCGG